KPIGKQDQYMAAFGGLTTLNIAKDGCVSVSRMALPMELLETLEGNILLFYTGNARDTESILVKQDLAAKKNDRVVLSSLREIKDIGIEISSAIAHGNLRRFGELLDVHWQSKKRLSDGISNRQIDDWYDLAKQSGAIGGKISGAGGGGFLMLYCEESKPRVREAMCRAGLRELRFRFEHEGSKVMMDVISRDGRLAHMQRQGCDIHVSPRPFVSHASGGLNRNERNVAGLRQQAAVNFREVVHSVRNGNVDVAKP